MLLGRYFLGSAVLDARRCVVTISGFLIIRILRTRVNICDVIEISVRRVLSNAAFQVLDAFKSFMCLRPMALAFLYGRRRNVVRNYEVGVLCGIYVTNFNAFKTCPAAILHARFTRQYTFSMSRIQSNSGRFVVYVRIFQVRFF